jgi:hypothetical protein
MNTVWRRKSARERLGINLVFLSTLLLDGHLIFCIFNREVNTMIHNKTGKVFALKKILMHNEREGVLC